METKLRSDEFVIPCEAVKKWERMHPLQVLHLQMFPHTLGCVRRERYWHGFIHGFLVAIILAAAAIGSFAYCVRPG